MSQILVLDVDGVIIDGFPRNRWDTSIQEDLGIDPVKMQNMLFGDAWADVLNGKRTKQSLVADFLAQVGSQVSVSEFIDYWHGNDANVQQSVLDAAVTWRDKTGGRLAIATNQDPARARYLREELKFDDYFDVAIISSEIGAKKPEPRYFTIADELLSASAQTQIYFLDDSIDNVTAATQHGWRAIHVDLPERAADIILKLPDQAGS